MASYKLTSNEGAWPLSPGENLVGRFSHCVVRIDDPGVAGEHALIDLAGEIVQVTDLGSESGTFIDDVRVGGTQTLAPGQTLRIGPPGFGATFHLEGPGPARRWLANASVRRAARIGVGLALGALVALAVLFVVLSLVFNADRLQRDIVRAIESSLDRDAEIGKVELRLFRGRTELGDIVVHNLPEFGEEPFLKVPSASARFHSGRYLGSLGTILRAEVTLERPVLLLERNERGNWNVGDLTRAVARSVLAARKDLSWSCPYSGLKLHIRARDATVRIRDDLAGESREITGITFDADLPGLGRPLTYRVATEVPVGGRPGRVELTGSVTLFRDGRLTVDSVRGELLKLGIEGLDLRAIPRLVPENSRNMATAVGEKTPGDRTPPAPHGSGRGAAPRAERLPPGFPEVPAGAALDLDMLVSADSLKAVRARIEGRLRWPEGGGGGVGAPGSTYGAPMRTARRDVSLEADLSGAVVSPQLERGEIALRGPGWKFDCQGRLIPASSEATEPGQALGGAELLDLDAVLEADLKALDGLRGLVPGLLSGAPLDGRLAIELSTSGPTRELVVRAKIGAEGLDCPRTPAPPEDVSIGLEGTVRFAGWSGLDGASLKGCIVEASFIHASVAPGEMSLLTTPELASALVGPLEFELDLEELDRRYGPLLPFRIPGSRLHGWAELEGSGGRLRARSAIVSRSGGAVEGTATIDLAAEGGPRVEFDWRAGEPEGSRTRLRGSVSLGRDEPGFDVAVSASGELSRVLEMARPHLRPAESLWARGRFNLDEVRVSGTPSRFSTTGRLELLEPELWGGSPTTPPFSESRFDANWNLDFDLSRGPVRMKANLLKGSSSTLQFRLSGEVEDLRRGLGRYDLRAFADFDRLGAMLKKLGLVPARAALRGTMNVELKADTGRGDIELGRLELDTPFIEVQGGGKIHHVPLASLFASGNRGKDAGASLRSGVSVPKLPEAVSGRLHVAAKLNVDEIAGLARSLPSEESALGGEGRPGAEATGEIGLDFTAEGSGGELLVSGKIDLDRFAGRLGRHVRKPAGGRASLDFSASVAARRPELVTLRSGVLTLGGADRPARLELKGSLARRLDGFELAVRSERFAIAPVAALFEELAPECTGAASVDLRSRGRLVEGALVPGTLVLDGEIKLLGAELSLRRLPALTARVGGALSLAGRSLSGKGLTVAILRRAPGESGTFRDLGVLRLAALEVGSRLDLPGVSLSFDARADEFDLGGLAAGLWAAGGTIPGLSRLPARAGPSAVDRTGEALVSPALHVDGRLAVGLARVWPTRCELADMVAKAELADGKLRLGEMTATLWGGRLSGEASIDLTAAKPRARGKLKVEDIDLAEAAKAAAIPGALTGKGAVSLSWEGDGLGARDLVRDWGFDLEGGTGEVELRTELFPFAREVKSALAKILGIPAPVGGSRSRPVTVRVACRRGRTTMAATDFEFEDGLELVVRGRTELDGRIACWVTVKRLPDNAGSIPAARRKVIDELVRREALRFAVTGTWARPVVDVKGLLSWMLPGAPRGEPPEAPAPPARLEPDEEPPGVRSGPGGAGGERPGPPKDAPSPSSAAPPEGAGR